MYQLKKLRDTPELAQQAVTWFHQKWSIPREAYAESIGQCIIRQKGVPQWYVLTDTAGNIAAGAGVIENDFHMCKRFRPNICGVYVEEAHRGKGLARRLLTEICNDMAQQGENVLYLLTDHIGFYEKLGWHYVGMAKENSGSSARVYQMQIGK